MPTRLIICDLDSTLFDSSKFIKSLPQAVEAVFIAQAVQAEAFEAEIRSKDFYAPAGYDFVAHLAHYGLKLKPTHKQSLITSLRNHFGSFVFPEVSQFIAHIRSQTDIDMAIMTVGVPEAQEFKLELCADDLAEIPYEVTSQNKGSLLGSYWTNGIYYRGVKYESATVIDDSAEQLITLPTRANIEAVQMYRENQRYAKSDDQRINRTISTLADAL